MDVASTTAAFIDSVSGSINENIVPILTFAAGILVWGIAKKWIFGGTKSV